MLLINKYKISNKCFKSIKLVYKYNIKMYYNIILKYNSIQNLRRFSSYSM